MIFVLFCGGEQPPFSIFVWFWWGYYPLRYAVSNNNTDVVVMCDKINMVQKNKKKQINMTKNKTPRFNHR